MTLKEIASAIPCTMCTGEDRLDRVVSGGYAGDLLSDVIAHAGAGSVWITMQVHLNIVAVAVLKDLAGIIIVQGRRPAEETLAKAREEHLPILVSDLPAFETAARLSTVLADGT